MRVEGERTAPVPSTSSHTRDLNQHQPSTKYVLFATTNKGLTGVRNFWSYIFIRSSALQLPNKKMRGFSHQDETWKCRRVQLIQHTDRVIVLRAHFALPACVHIVDIWSVVCRSKEDYEYNFDIWRAGMHSSWLKTSPGAHQKSAIPRDASYENQCHPVHTIYMVGHCDENPVCSSHSTIETAR